MKHQSSSPDSTTAMVDKIANIVSDYYDEDAAGRWRKCAQHIADSLTDEAATPGITGHQYRRARYEEPAATPQVSLKRMGLSDGRTDYFVMIKVGDREVSPHVFRDEYKAAYHVALYDWLLTGRGEKPEIVAFGPHDWPARPVDPAQAPTAPDVELERDMWIAAAGGEAEIGKREAAKAEALYLLVNEAQAALVEFKRWCRTDISRKSWDALHALEDVLSRPVGPNIPLSDLANDLQQASSVSSTEGK
jgi:hypothetical protein